MYQILDIIGILLLAFFAYSYGKEVGKSEILEKEIEEEEFKLLQKKLGNKE